MRKLLLLALVFSVSGAACKWTEFDDLSDQTWVHSTTKPDVKSSDWGTAMTTAQHSGDGGLVLVIGQDSPTFATIKHDKGGGTSLGQGGIDLNEQFAINAIPDQPLLISDSSDAVALVIPTGDGRTILEGGVDPTKPHQLDVIEKDALPNGAAFVGTGSALSVLVAGEGVVQTGSMTTNNFHVVPVVNGTTTSCAAQESDFQTSLNAVAIAVDPNIGSDGTVFAWTAEGTLVGYDLGEALACGNGSATAILTAEAQVPGWGGSGTGSDAVDVGFQPVTASMFEIPPVGTSDQLAILAGHTDPTKDDKGEVIVVDLTTGTVVGQPLELTDSLRGLAVGALADGKEYLALGFPNRTVSGTASAGQVEVYELDVTQAAAGAVIAGTPTMLLFDDQPDSNELFGRSITMTNFNDQQILVVGAENEMFSYYETQVYGDTRK